MTNIAFTASRRFVAMSMVAAALGLSSFPLAGTAGAQVSATTQRVVIDNASVVFIRAVRVPAQVEGMLTEVLIEEGTKVEAGEPLAILDDRDSQLALKLKQAEEVEAKLNAENDINRKYAEQSFKLSSEKADAFEELAEDRIMPKWEARQARLEAYRDGLQIDLAVINRDIAVAKYDAKSVERQIAERELAKRRITAPFAGFVEQRIAQLGEWVQPGAPIVRLVQLDRLRAQGYLDQDLANRVSVGMPVVLEFPLGNGAVERINARVGFVGYETNLSEQRRIWVEFENQMNNNDWLIKPGMKPNIVIDLAR